MAVILLRFEPLNYREPSEVDAQLVVKIEPKDYYNEIVEKNGKRHKTREDINRLYTRLNYLLKQARSEQ